MWPNEHSCFFVWWWWHVHWPSRPPYQFVAGWYRRVRGTYCCPPPGGFDITTDCSYCWHYSYSRDLFWSYLRVSSLHECKQSTFPKMSNYCFRDLIWFFIQFILLELQICLYMLLTSHISWLLNARFRRLRLLSRRERSGVTVGGHPSVRHHQAEDQRVVSPRPTSSRAARLWREGADVHVCACGGGWISAHGCERHRGEWHKVVFKKKTQKKKQRKKWLSLSDVVEHCVFCGLKFSNVLTQPAGGNVCNHFPQLQSKLFNLETMVPEVKRSCSCQRLPKQSSVQSTKN